MKFLKNIYKKFIIYYIYFCNIILHNMCADNNENSRPITPSEEDCCHNACDPCIFDVHKKLLEEYERKKKQNIKIQNKQNILHLYKYKNFVVFNIEERSECYILIVLKYYGI